MDNLKPDFQFNDEFLDGIKKAADALHAKIDSLQAKCDRYEKALNRVANTSYDTGREGCTWGDTDYDSMSAVTGYNQCVDNVTSIANEALSAGEGPTEQEIEAEITRRWNSKHYNFEGVLKREFFREAVMRDFKNKKEDQ